MTERDPSTLSWDEAWPEPCAESALLAASGRDDAADDGHPRLVWHEAAPGGDLAQLVASFEREGISELSDYDLVELAAAAGRLASWAHHVAASAAGELARRPVMDTATPSEFSASLTPARLAGEELAMRLGVSSRAGERLVREGTSFAAHLHATGQALRTGRIDATKARAIVDGLDGVPVELALGVQDMVLPRAPQRTPRQLAADVRAALVELDPPEAVARREAAQSRRHVTKPVPLGDGMAGLWLRTGAVEATALYASIDEAARRARARGDSRTLDQLRADLLVERGLYPVRCGAQQTDGTGPEGAQVELPRTPGGSLCPTTTRIDVRVLVPLSTLLGTRDEAALLEGYGPIDPELARCLARAGTWRRLVTDPASGAVLDVGRTRYAPPAEIAEHVRSRDLECVRPTCETSAWRSELDHVVPFADGGPTAVSNLAPLSKGCHQLKTHGGFSLAREGDGALRWSTPTGHSFVHRPPPALRALDAENPVHRAREDLEHLARAPARPVARSHAEPEGDEPPPF